MRAVRAMSAPRSTVQDTFVRCRQFLLVVPCDVCTLASLSLWRRKAAIRLAIARPCVTLELRSFGCRHTSTQEEF